MIRRAEIADTPQLLQLMRKLAQFEGYDERFAVTADALVERGFPRDGAPQFLAWVAQSESTLVGYAVIYIIPFTFDLRPTVVLKELFVDASARGQKLGHGLMNAVIEHAQTLNARLIRWQVLPDNEPAKNFYRGFGAGSDADWENWFLDLDT